MSSLKEKSSAIKNRLKPFIPGVAVGMLIGAAITAKLIHSGSGDVWLSERMTQQLKDRGQGMFEIAETNQLVDMIDWGHPATEHLSRIAA